MRRAVTTLHKYMSLLIGGLLLMLGITGSLLVFSEAIDEIRNPEVLRVAAGQEPLPVSSMLAAVRAAYPNDRVTRIHLPQTGHDSLECWLDDQFGGRKVYVNPFTGSVLGERVVKQTITGWLFLLHSELLSGMTGKLVQAIAGICALMVLLTGFYSWWPGISKLSGALKVRSKRWGPKRFLELHGIIGAVLLLPLALVAVTGLVMVQNKEVERFINSVGPDRPAVRRLLEVGGSLDEALTRLTRATGMQPTYVAFGGDDTLRVRLRERDERHRTGTSVAIVDLRSGQAEVVRGADSTFGTRAIRASYVLHTGAWAGTAGRATTFLSGIAILVLAATGFYVWAFKTRRSVAGVRASEDTSKSVTFRP